MKMKSKGFNFLVAIAFLFSLLGCYGSKEKVVYPEPSENPVFLSADAQSKDIFVKYLNLIGCENPETDIEENGNYSTDSDSWSIIKNDWITIKYGYGVPKETIRITVQENTSNQSRSYKLATYHMGYKRIVTITQNGKQ